jgi:putative ABC transport system permease protein
VGFSAVILKNLLRRKTRSGLTIAGLGAAVATAIALLNMAWGYARATVDLYARRGIDLVVIRAGVANRSSSNLSSALVARISQLPMVAEAEGSLTEQVSFGKETLVGIPLQGLDPDGFSIKTLTIAAGRTLTAADRNKVLLGTALAESLGKRTEDSVEIEGTSFQVVGLFRTDDPLEAATAIARLSDVQQLFDRPATVTEVQVHVASPANADREADIRRVCGLVEGLADNRGLPVGLKAYPTEQFVNGETTLQLATTVAWGTSFLAIGLSLFGVLNTMLMSTFERTREFGMLRAIGWRRGRILRMIVGESLVMSAVAALGGIGVAWCVLQILADWAATQSIVSPDLVPGSVLCGIALAFVAGLIGAIYPAYRGATISPVEALRYE